MRNGLPVTPATNANVHRALAAATTHARRLPGFETIGNVPHPEPPSNMPRGPQAAKAWHDLTPTQRKQEISLDLFARKHFGTTGWNARHYVKKNGEYKSEMYRHLQQDDSRAVVDPADVTPVRRDAHASRGSEVAMAWHAYKLAADPDDLKQIGDFAYDNGMTKRGLSNYVDPTGDYTLAMIPYLPPDDPFVLQHTARHDAQPEARDAFGLTAEDWAAVEPEFPAEVSLTGTSMPGAFAHVRNTEQAPTKRACMEYETPASANAKVPSFVLELVADSDDDDGPSANEAPALPQLTLEDVVAALRAQGP